MSQIDSTKRELIAETASESLDSKAGPGNDWPRMQWSALYFVALVGFIAFIAAMRFEGSTIENSAIPLFLLAVGIGIHVFAGVNGKVALSIGGLALAMAVSWQHAFSEMWLRWFPGWIVHKGAPITTRLSAGDSYYSHAPLVPIASLIIAFLIHKRVGFPTNRTQRSLFWGGLALAGAWFLQIIASRGDVTFVAGFALIGVIASLTLLWGGWSLLRAYWLPIAFLFFMVPLPMDTIYQLNFDLKMFAGKSALWLTNNVFGVPAVQTGASIHLMPDPITGDPKTLVVENVCSGLRSLISLICFGTLFAMMCRLKGPWRLFMLAMAVPLALACNIVRITSMNLVSHYDSVEAAGEGSWFHTFSGLMVFALALGALFGLEQIISFIGRKWKKNWTDPRILGYLDDMPRTKQKDVRLFHPIALAALVYVFSLSVLYANEEVSMNRTNVARNAVPATLSIDGSSFDSDEQEMSKLEMSILQTQDYLKRRYTDKNKREVDLTIVFSANNRKGTHPPDVCLEGGGGRIIHKDMHQMTFTGMEDDQPTERNIELKELVSQRPVKVGKGQYQTYRNYHLYVYKCGGTYTASYFWQQAIIFANGIVNRDASGALIRIDVPVGWDEAVTDNDVQVARELAIKAAKVFMTEIDKGLR